MHFLRVYAPAEPITMLTFARLLTVVGVLFLGVLFLKMVSLPGSEQGVPENQA